MSKPEKPAQQQYALSPKWTIARTSNSLLISGGADAKYSIDIETEEQSFFETIKPDQAFNISSLNSFDKRIFEQLLTAEVIVPLINFGVSTSIATIGDANNLNLNNRKKFNFVDIKEAHDFIVIIRTNSSYSNLLSKIDYKNINKPHLIIDTTFHHTISIGPLVFPGETACIACLEGRLKSRWEDDTPPPTPAMTVDNQELTTSLLWLELSKIISGDTSLINKTISWNFQNRTVAINQLLKVPICPICNQNKIDLGGILVLPWTKNESINNTI